MADRGRGGRGRGHGDFAPRGGHVGQGRGFSRGGRGDGYPRGGQSGQAEGFARGGRGDGYPRGGHGRGGAFQPAGQGPGQGRGGDRGGRGGRGFNKPRPQVYRPAIQAARNLDPKVTALENTRQQARHTPQVLLGSLGLDSGDGGMPARPGYGSVGPQIAVYANYVELYASPTLSLYSYAISKVKPEAVGKKLVQIIRLLVTESPELAEYRDDMVTDFKSTIISRKKLEWEGRPKDIVIKFKKEGEDDAKEHAAQYAVTLGEPKFVTVGDLLSYLTSTDPARLYENKEETIQALNIFLNHHARSADNLATIGSSKTFSMSAGAEHESLGRGLIALRGFFTSVRAATNRVLVNINVSHGAFYQDGPLTALIKAYYAPPNEKGMRALAKFLKLVRVRTTHLREKRNKKNEVVVRAKTIFGLADIKNGTALAHSPQVSRNGAGPKDVKFWLQDQQPSSTSAALVPGLASSQATPPKKGKSKGKGNAGKTAIGPQPLAATTGRYISVHDHFKNTYNIITSNDFPVINVGTDENPSYLPAEVCVVLPGQVARTKLSGDQTRNMIKFAVRGPWLNAESIVKNGLQTAGLSSQTNPLLDQFGLSFGKDLITVPARLLPPPSVYYRSKNAVELRNAGWSMEKAQFTKGGELKKWSWLAISQGNRPAQYSEADLPNTITKFAASLNKIGLGGQHTPLKGRTIRISSHSDSELEWQIKDASEHLHLLLIILPGRDKSDNTELYSFIKTLGDIKYGIHTICVVGQRFMKLPGQDQYFANVSLKFNLKLGGNNQMVEPERLSFIREGKTMVVGIDVTHPSPGSSDHAPSVAGMVASIDEKLSQWPGVLGIQGKSRQEMVTDIKSMLTQHLDNWLTLGKHSQLPESILVYRDGVSEGQYQTVLEQELPLLRSACAAKYPPAATEKGFPRLSIVIVGKRHHTRFYPRDAKDMDGGGNCRPGTVVDRGVTEEGTWDFFLQAHAAIQGTARPAHYVVVLDEIFRSRARELRLQGPSQPADDLERVTHALCYSYSRATKAVSICTPAYHADILCERARRYMADLFEGSASDDASSVGGAAGGDASGGMNSRVTPHAKLRNTMFYI